MGSMEFEPGLLGCNGDVTIVTIEKVIQTGLNGITLDLTVLLGFNGIWISLI